MKMEVHLPTSSSMIVTVEIVLGTSTGSITRNDTSNSSGFSLVMSSLMMSTLVHTSRSSGPKIMLEVNGIKSEPAMERETHFL